MREFPQEEVMRIAETEPVVRLPIVVVCTLVLACLSCQAPPEPELSRSGEPSEVSMVARSDEGAVIAAHREWIRAFQDGDVDAALALLVPNDRLLIFHPYLENRFGGHEETREGLTRMMGRLKDLEWTEVHQTLDMQGNVAWFTSQILIKASGLEPPFVGRGTEIWIRHKGDWRLSHGHWSEHARLAGTRQDG
jgi:ketosteroid isomerase-like protein